MKNFFATGNEYIRDGLDLKFIPRLNLSDNDSLGVIRADDNQTLEQGYLLAKDIFAKAEPRSIKFVLIGLMPYVFSANEKEPPIVCEVNGKILDNYFKLCIDNGAKPVAFTLPVKKSRLKIFKADVLKTFRDTINKVVKRYKATFIDFSDCKLEDKCFQAAALSALLGARLYSAKIFSLENILDMEGEYFNVLEKYFVDEYKTLTQHIFCRMATEDFNRLCKTSPKEDCLALAAQVFSEMTYNHLVNLSDMLPKDDYNDLAARVFEISAEKIRHKDKILLGFCFNYSAAWCGDDLYNYFAHDERFEVKIFFRSKGNAITRKEEYSPDLERFKAHGLNVVEVEMDSDIPQQDVLFQLSPYYQYDPKPFHLINLKVRTLMAYTPYGYGLDQRVGFFSNWSFFRVLWKIFVPSIISLEQYKKMVKVGMPRGVYSGYAKMDIFFKKDMDFHFDWKMARPDAKKIIYSPHHSMGPGGSSTFPQNYQFMYEFAKAHPEISWVLKPHPNLLPASVRAKIFSNAASAEEYYKKWNDLPNAQLYTGAYYQALFATSDGMIQDCVSFIAEYQYVDKPMIYLMSNKIAFNELGEIILAASYTVDGKDLDGIAAMIQRVFIDGDDYKAAQRREVFDKYLNYPKANGMLASEFIYKNIADELKEESK